MSCHESIEKRAEREANEFTKRNCPVKVAEYIINDSMRYEKETHTIHYFYSLQGMLDTAILVAPPIKEEHIKNLKNTTSLKSYKENNFNFAYTYFSSKHKGKILIDVLVKPEEYKGK